MASCSLAAHRHSRLMCMNRVRERCTDRCVCMCPRQDRYHPGRGLDLPLRSEEKPAGHHAFEVHEHIQAVVDEVRNCEFAAVLCLLRPLQAEAQTVWSDTRAFRERVMPQPMARPVLD